MQPDPAQPDAKPAQSSARKVDKAAAYYHYTLAHMYEEHGHGLWSQRSGHQGHEEYRLAIDADPSSEFLTSGLAELYAKTGRIADAVQKRRTSSSAIPRIWKPTSFWAAFICARSGDMPGGNGSDNILQTCHRAVRADHQARS